MICYLLLGLIALHNIQLTAVSNKKKSDEIIKNIGFTKQRTLTGHRDIIQAMHIMKNGLLASGAADFTVRIWDIDQNVTKSISHDSKVILSVEELTDGRIIYGSNGGPVKLWDYVNDMSKTLVNLEKEHISLGTLIALHGGEIALSAREKSIQIWDFDKDVCLKTSSLEQHKAWISSLAVLKNSNFLISSSWDKTIKLWDTSGEKLTCIKTFQGHTDCVNVVKQLSNHILVSASDDKTIMLWDIDSSTSKTTLYGHSDRIYTLLVADGKIISGSRDKTVKIWDPLLSDCILTIPCSDKIYSLAYCVNRKQLFVGLGCGDIEVFHVDF